MLGLFHWAKATDLPIHIHQVVGQAQEFAILVDLVLGFPDGRGGRQALRHRMAIDFLGELEMRAMPRIIGFRAMTGRFATFARGTGNGTGLEISEFGNLA